MFQNIFLALLVLAWTLIILTAFCPLREWLRRRTEAACDKRRGLTSVKDG